MSKGEKKEVAHDLKDVVPQVPAHGDPFGAAALEQAKVHNQVTGPMTAGPINNPGSTVGVSAAAKDPSAVVREQELADPKKMKAEAAAATALAKAAAEAGEAQVEEAKARAKAAQEAADEKKKRAAEEKPRHMPESEKSPMYRVTRGQTVAWKNGQTLRLAEGKEVGESTHGPGCIEAFRNAGVALELIEDEPESKRKAKK